MNSEDLERLETCKKTFERDAQSLGVIFSGELERKENGDYKLARTQLLFTLYCTAVAEGANRVVNVIQRRNTNEHP